MPPPFALDTVTLPFGLQTLIGLVVGWLVDRLRAETSIAEARAAEAEDLRDRLGHRADVLEAVNRAARALGSSLDQSRAFAAFRDELQSMIPFDQLRIEVAGETDSVFAASGGLVGGTEGDEVVAPPMLGDRAPGTLTVAREAGPAFTAEEGETPEPRAAQGAAGGGKPVGGGVKVMRPVRANLGNALAITSFHRGRSAVARGCLVRHIVPAVHAPPAHIDGERRVTHASKFGADRAVLAAAVRARRGRFTIRSADETRRRRRFQHRPAAGQ